MDKSGGRPRKETTGFEEIKTTGYSQKKPNVNDNENVNVNDNDNVNANDNVGDSCVDGLQKIINFYNENIGLITSYGIDILSDYANEMSADLIILAMKKAVEANVRTIQYIKGILNNWSKQGIKTVLDAEEEDKKFREKDKKEEIKETQKERIARLKKEWGVEDET